MTRSVPSLDCKRYCLCHTPCDYPRCIMIMALWHVKAFHVTVPLCGEWIHWSILFTKSSNKGVLMFFLSQTWLNYRTNRQLVIWNTLVPMWHYCNYILYQILSHVDEQIKVIQVCLIAELFLSLDWITRHLHKNIWISARQTCDEKPHYETHYAYNGISPPGCHT